MKSLVAKYLSRRVIWVFLFLLAGSASIYFFAAASNAQKNEDGKGLSTPGSRVRNVLPNPEEPADLANFRAVVGGKITPVIVELNDEPGAVLQFRQSLNIKDGRTAFEKLAEYAVELSGKQDQFQQEMPERGVRLLMRTVEARQIDGALLHKSVAL